MPYLVSLTRKTTRFSVPQLGNLGNQKEITITKKIKPSELKAAAQRVVREGKMDFSVLWTPIQSVANNNPENIYETKRRPPTRR
jgi:hypothetical protein